MEYKKYKHTVNLTAEMTLIINDDHSDDLSEKYGDAMKQLLSLFSSNVNIIRSQDIIRKRNDEEDLGDWIRFDPTDRLTWPPENSKYDFDIVLVCSEDDYIYIGNIFLLRKEPTTKFKWWLSNTSEDIQVPLDVVKAWQPLPKPFHM